MKNKLITSVCMVLLICAFANLAFAASASTNYTFSITATSSGMATTPQYYWKQDTCNYCEVRYVETGAAANAGFTNYLSIHVKGFGYIGAKWVAPNGIYAAFTSSQLTQGKQISPAIRANARYLEEMGLSQVTFSGQIRPH